MKKLQKKQAGLRRRHTRVRGKISGTAERPRLCITRSNANMYAQVIDDVTGKTICALSTLGPDFKKKASPKWSSIAVATSIMVASRLLPTVPVKQA